MRSNNTIRLEREQRGWSQGRLAQELCTDSVTISRWERGVSSPSPYFREKLSLVFGKTLAELGLQTPTESDMQSLTALAGETYTTPIILELDSQNQPLQARERNLASLSYLFGWASGLLCLLRASSPFVRHHARRSVLVFGGLSLLLAASYIIRGLISLKLANDRLLLNQQLHQGLLKQRQFLIDPSFQAHMLERQAMTLLFFMQWGLVIGTFLFWITSLWIASHGYKSFTEWLSASSEKKQETHTLNPSQAQMQQ